MGVFFSSEEKGDNWTVSNGLSGGKSKEDERKDEEVG